MQEPSDVAVGLRREISQLQQRITELQDRHEKSEEKYRVAFQHTGAAMLIVEADTTVTTWNHKLEEVTGYTHEFADQGRKWIDFVYEEDLPMMIEYHKNRPKHPEKYPSEYEFRLKHKSGALRTILMNASVIPGTEQILISMVDITDRKKAQEERLRLLQEEAADAAREVKNLKLEMMEHATFHAMVSASPNMREIFEVLPQIADVEATVLITGESGTGKELVARSLHDLGRRNAQPFVAVNCAALPDNLLESELFGYKAGAFTDAKKDKPGKFALAEGGSIFLDEIGDISMTMQAKLLRVLQEKEYEPLGGIRSFKADVRVVAATNKDLPALIEAGTFREDLYYRLNVLMVHLPPLRERRRDIPYLCKHFITQFNQRYNKKIKSVSSKALDYLLSQEFKGNIRELENSMERAFVLCRGSVIQPEHLPQSYAGKQAISVPDAPFAGIETLAQLEKVFLEKLLSDCNGSRSMVATRLGMHRVTLYRKLKQLGI